eukprot:2320797-Pyramimonas_sp.AAC.1
MEDGGRFLSTCGSRLSAAHIRLKRLQEASRMEGGSFSKCGSRLRAAHIRPKILQQFQGFLWLTSRKQCFGTRMDCKGATSRNGYLERFRLVGTT